MSEEMLRAELVALGARFAARGMAIGSAGNLSVRLADGYLVTPTNAELGALKTDRLAKLDQDWRHIGGDKPTKEVAMHRAFYATRPGCGAVVHLHSTSASALSFRAGLPALDPIPPFSPYFLMRVGHLPVLPYFRPGSDAIGEAIAGLNGRYRAVLLQNHGPATCGATLAEAVSAAEELEETARIFLLLGNTPPRLLSEAEQAELKETFSLDW